MREGGRITRPQPGPVVYVKEYDSQTGRAAYYREQLVSPYGWAQSQPGQCWWSRRPISEGLFYRKAREGHKTVIRPVTRGPKAIVINVGGRRAFDALRGERA